MMRMMILAASFVLGGCASMPQYPEPPAMLAPVSAGVDQAGNRIEPLGGDMEERCSFDGAWCVEPGRFRNRDGQLIEAPTRERAQPAPWGYLIRAAQPADAVLLGQLWRTTDAYSGGGASETVLVLYRLADGRAEPVLELLQAGDALIRACFSQADMRTRAGACHDDYRFSSSIALDPAYTGAWPRLIYETSAVTFPGRVSRGADSTARGALAEADLVWAIDERCTITRAFTWNAGARAYMPDAPLPDCTDYRTQ